MNSSDKILLLRGILGLLSGVVTLVLPNYTVFLISIIVSYSISVVVSKVVFNVQGKWDTLGRGVVTLLLSWFLTVLIIYNFIHS
ncbi:hypothetical protein IC006_1860 [Sulfuracidifex tepidarius]|uniref:Uncharacterized protein n=1 Tax=Sulfuracidifex tepidarius TaxID=1294262 RepID=A0A510E478_9CREN|nr:hypothetical protein IC006_1860 [Sulfuracidifex tepidarius]BBG27323.1 hypothetical protein IC007_1868 [Sulfuracidifex tepidarius]